MGVLNSTRLLSREGQAEIENRLEAKRVYWITAILSFPLFGFGLSRTLTQSGQDRLIGIFELVIGVLIFINALIYSRLRLKSVAKSFLSVCSIILSMGLLMSGGTHGTGIYWSIVFQTTNFPFLGLRLGSIFSVLFFLSFFFVDQLQHLGLLQTSYESAVLDQAAIILAIIAALGLVAEKTRVNYQQAASKQKERIRVLLEELPVGVILLSAPDGTPKIVNGELERLLGRDIRDDINLEEFISIYGLATENRSLIAVSELPLGIAMQRGVESGPTSVFIKRPDGSDVVANISASPIKNPSGEVVSVVGIFEDETQQYEVDRMKSELVSLASHQLKTPMTSIKWTMETLLDNEMGELNERQSSLLQPVLDTVDQLVKFVNDLLTVSRIETGRKFKVTPEPANVTPIIKSVIDGLRKDAEEKEVELKVDLPPVLGMMADHDKFGDMMRIIIENAVKYSNPKGKVTIASESSPGAGLTLTVSDEGVGIPEREQGRIFERFFRGSNIREKTDGTGLGLHIAYVIAERHDGRIWFKSEQGAGTTFYVYLKPAIAPDDNAPTNNGNK